MFALQVCQFADALWGSGAVVEAGLDDLAIVIYQCKGIFLCSNANDDGSVNITDVVQLVAYIVAAGLLPIRWRRVMSTAVAQSMSLMLSIW